MNVSEAIAKRKSVRAYDGRPVEAADVQTIVQAGHWAPNAGEYHMAVVTGPDLLKRINERAHHAMVNSGNDFLISRAALPGYEPIYGAPLLILVSAPEEAWFGAVDTALPAENMLLQATELGYGSCFIVTPAMALNRPEDQPLAREAGVPEGHKIHCVVLVGHASGADHLSIPEDQRKPRGTISYR